jgi:Na+/melibiose symporter-like transporter
MKTDRDRDSGSAGTGIHIAAPPGDTAQPGSRLQGGGSVRAICYGLLGLPLAMSALPVYVHIPAYYTRELGTPLVATGLVLFLARLVDTVQDPVLGLVIDRQRQAGPQRIVVWMAVAGVLLALAFAGLWLPPLHGSAALLAWLALMLILAYSAHSMLNIAYLSWGARLPGDLLKPAAWREGLGLTGVILASVIPGLIMAGQGAANIRTGLNYFALGFAVVLALALIALLRFASHWQNPPAPDGAPARGAACEAATGCPMPTERTDAAGRDTADAGAGTADAATLHPAWWPAMRRAMRQAIANRAFVQLLVPYFLNALSASIAATLSLFFIADRLGQAHLAGYFLASYFLAGALGLPLWVKLARRIGNVVAWRSSMLLALAGFGGAALLGPGDMVGYFAVCLASGFALGADLALPPVLLAQVIPPDQAPANYYGIWTLLGKLALALSGLCLPLLAQFNYQPGHSQGSTALLAMYAFLPCACKALAFLALHRFALRFDRAERPVAPLLKQEPI